MTRSTSLVACVWIILAATNSGRTEETKPGEPSNLPPEGSAAAIEFEPGPPPTLIRPPLPPRTSPTRPSPYRLSDDIQYMPIPSVLNPIQPSSAERPAALQVADTPPSARSTAVSRVQHLREAARHLEAAGHSDAAQVYREEADALLAASIETLNTKRKQLQQLQQEVAELERVTGHCQLVLLKCRYVELDVNALNRLGIDLAALFENDRTPPGAGLPAGLYSSGEINAAVDALAAHGAAKVIAEPSLVTTNGRPTTFHSGGEFPIPVPGADDELTLEWCEYGVRLEAVPNVLGGGKIRLEVSPEISERDFENAVEVDGLKIPGLTVRRLNTEAEMEFGQSLVAACVAPKPQDVQQTAGDDRSTEPQTTFLFIITPEPVPTGASPSDVLPQPIEQNRPTER